MVCFDATKAAKGKSRETQTNYKPRQAKGSGPTSLHASYCQHASLAISLLTSHILTYM